MLRRITEHDKVEAAKRRSLQIMGKISLKDWAIARKKLEVSGLKCQIAAKRVIAMPKRQHGRRRSGQNMRLLLTNLQPDS